MRKTLIATLLAASLPLAAFAGMHHDGPHGRDGGARDGRHCPHESRGMPMLRGLELNAEQRQQASRLMREHHQGLREINQRYLDKLPEAERKAMQADIQASHEQHHQALRNLLSEEQRKAFDERQAEREARRAEWAEFLEWKKQKEAAAN